VADGGNRPAKERTPIGKNLPESRRQCASPHLPGSLAKAADLDIGPQGSEIFVRIGGKPGGPRGRERKAGAAGGAWGTLRGSASSPLFSDHKSGRPGENKGPKFDI